MLASIGVMLLLAGVSIFLIALIRTFFPSSAKFNPNDFKKLVTLRNAVYIFLLGLVLTRFF
jgi:hypothetical protein